MMEKALGTWSSIASLAVASFVLSPAQQGLAMSPPPRRQRPTWCVCRSQQRASAREQLVQQLQAALQAETSPGSNSSQSTCVCASPLEAVLALLEEASFDSAHVLPYKCLCCYSIAHSVSTMFDASMLLLWMTCQWHLSTLMNEPVFRSAMHPQNCLSDCASHAGAHGHWQLCCRSKSPVCGHRCQTGQAVPRQPVGCTCRGCCHVCPHDQQPHTALRTC